MPPWADLCSRRCRPRGGGWPTEMTARSEGRTRKARIGTGSIDEAPQTEKCREFRRLINVKDGVSIVGVSRWVGIIRRLGCAWGTTRTITTTGGAVSHHPSVVMAPQQQISASTPFSAQRQAVKRPDRPGEETAQRRRAATRTPQITSVGGILPEQLRYKFGIST